jgi:hypothetical protein
MSAVPPVVATADNGDAVDDGFRLVSIRHTPAPTGNAGRDWYVYRIAQGANIINGYRHGELAAVTAEVEKIVTGLNERRIVKRGRVDLRPGRPTAAAAAAATAAAAAGAEEPAD